jgi:hypothetical protein
VDENDEDDENDESVTDGLTGGLTEAAGTIDQLNGIDIHRRSTPLVSVLTGIALAAVGSVLSFLGCLFTRENLRDVLAYKEGGLPSLAFGVVLLVLPGFMCLSIVVRICFARYFGGSLLPRFAWRVIGVVLGALGVLVLYGAVLCDQNYAALAPIAGILWFAWWAFRLGRRPIG